MKTTRYSNIKNVDKNAVFHVVSVPTDKFNISEDYALPVTKARYEEKLTKAFTSDAAYQTISNLTYGDVALIFKAVLEKSDKIFDQDNLYMLRIDGRYFQYKEDNSTSEGNTEGSLREIEAIGLEKSEKDHIHVSMPLYQKLLDIAARHATGNIAERLDELSEAYETGVINKNELSDRLIKLVEDIAFSDFIHYKI